MPDIVGLNRIFENKEQAIESFGELGERLLNRNEDGKQVLARYYDEDGNVASLIGVYHYKRTESGVDYGMFAFTYITNAPNLYADTLVEQCYREMFLECNRLKYIKCRANNISANDCLTNWVQGVASNGRFVRRNGTNIWPSGNNGIPNGWTVEQSYN